MVDHFKKNILFGLFCLFMIAMSGQVAFSNTQKSNAKQGHQKAALQDRINLVMVEEHGCPYCRAWMRDVGEFYHKTSEGKFAPLMRMDMDGARKKFNLNVNFTPTFVILKNGKEAGRLIGYIDDSFFWPKLDTILAKIGYKDAKEPS